MQAVSVPDIFKRRVTRDRVMKMLDQYVLNLVTEMGKEYESALFIWSKLFSVVIAGTAIAAAALYFISRWNGQVDAFATIAVACTIWAALGFVTDGAVLYDVAGGILLGIALPFGLAFGATHPPAWIIAAMAGALTIVGCISAYVLEILFIAGDSAEALYDDALMTELEKDAGLIERYYLVEHMVLPDDLPAIWVGTRLGTLDHVIRDSKLELYLALFGQIQRETSQRPKHRIARWMSRVT